MLFQVDFQLSVFSTPAVDLQYFFHTSPTLHVYKTCLSTLLKHYHACLCQCLKDLKYPVNKMPTLEHILEEFASRAFYGLVATVTVLPLVKAPKRDDATYEDLIINGDDEKEGGIRHVSYNCESYKQFVEYFLPLFDKQGLLD